MLESARATGAGSRAATVLAVLTLVFVVAGIFFRTYALDRKVYGFDETATLLRVSGTTLPDFVRAVETGAVHSTFEVRDRFQRLRSGTNASATVHSLAIDDPQHPPLYYVLERWWQHFGASIAFDRTLAVLFGLALLPAAWWLALELFDTTAAAVMVALVAVSPFHVLFAQYNREYSLWALLAALASAVFLRALKSGRRWWFGYAVCGALGLYTDPLFFFVLCAHGVYAAAQRSALPLGRGRAFVAALLAALLAFIPWLVVLATQPHLVSTSTAWNAVPLTARSMFEKWFFEISAVFFDAEYSRIALVPVALSITALACLAIVSAYLFEARRRALLFALLLTLLPTVPFLVTDLIFHTSRSTASRYLTPGWLGLELLVAAGLAAAMRDSRRRLAAVAFGTFAAIAVAGMYSLRQSSEAASWWIDSNDAALVPIASALDARTAPTICYADDAVSILILSDGATRPVGLRTSARPGCLAVATATHMNEAPGGRGAYDALPLNLSPTDRQFVNVHLATAKAHHTTYEPLQLWQHKPDAR